MGGVVLEGKLGDLAQGRDGVEMFDEYIPPYCIADYGGVGDGDSVTVEVDTTLGPTTCSAQEEIYQSGVETVNDCGARTIAAGGSSSCTITNTVFFEGIPTLSQYGMAIMALLMLGVGVVGLRRFV